MSKSSGTYVCPTPGPGRAPRCPRDSSCRGGPQREGRSRTPLTYAVKQSDSAIVAVRPANKGARASAESEEPRAGLAGNLRGLDIRRTPSRVTCGTRSPSRYGRVRFQPRPSYPGEEPYALARTYGSVRGVPGNRQIPTAKSENRSGRPRGSPSLAAASPAPSHSTSRRGAAGMTTRMAPPRAQAPGRSGPGAPLDGDDARRECRPSRHVGLEPRGERLLKTDRPRTPWSVPVLADSRAAGGERPEARNPGVRPLGQPPSAYLAGQCRGWDVLGRWWTMRADPEPSIYDDIDLLGFSSATGSARRPTRLSATAWGMRDGTRWPTQWFPRRLESRCWMRPGQASTDSIAGSVMQRPASHRGPAGVAPSRSGLAGGARSGAGIGDAA